MAFGLLHEEEMEWYWLKPGRLAVPLHGGGHTLMHTTTLCKGLYLDALAFGHEENDIARRVDEAMHDRGLSHELAFASVVFQIARRDRLELSPRHLAAARRLYAKRNETG